MGNTTDNQKATLSVEPVARTAGPGEVEGTAVDWSRFNEVVAVCDVGVIAAGETASFFLEEADVDDFSAGVVELDSLEDLAAAADQSAHLLHAKRVASSKKYVRVRHTYSDAALAGATLVLMQPQEAPVS